MILTSILLLGVVAAYLAFAGLQMFRLGIGFRQAILYTPMKLAWRIDDRRATVARKADAPVIYAVVHQARTDPALMLALLPDDTLHLNVGIDASADRAATTGSCSASSAVPFAIRHPRRSVSDAEFSAIIRT